MPSSLTLAFHGAAETVTGSKHLLTVDGKHFLLDAGLFQGLKELRLRNWADPPFEPTSLDQVIVSHTHIDHIGYLPRLAKLGLKTPVHLPIPASDLAELMLLDAAKIQEQDAEYANRKGYSKHSPAEPLYTVEDAEKALRLLSPQPYDQWFSLRPRGTVKVRFLNAGHILGSSFIEVRVATERGEVRIVYSGDLGRFEVPLHVDPDPLPECDILIVESTYGARRHPKKSVLDQIREPLEETFAKGGTALIPAFAVGRSQQITLMLRRLMREKKLPEVPIHIDSPMAINATRIYSRYLNAENVDADIFEDGRLQLFPKNVQFHRTTEESKYLNRLSGPRIIVSSSGMLSGGRVLHHLARLAGDPRNLLLLTGYQAEGTRGRALLDGAQTIKMHGRYIKVLAKVMTIDGLSGHADQDELLRWVENTPRPPRVAFVVHGSKESSVTFAELLKSRLKISAVVPHLGQVVDLQQPEQLGLPDVPW